jgi:hypothetical protein
MSERESKLIKYPDNYSALFSLSVESPFDQLFNRSGKYELTRDWIALTQSDWIKTNGLIVMKVSRFLTVSGGGDGDNNRSEFVSK